MLARQILGLAAAWGACMGNFGVKILRVFRSLEKDPPAAAQEMCKGVYYKRIHAPWRARHVLHCLQVLGKIFGGSSRPASYSQLHGNALRSYEFYTQIYFEFKSPRLESEAEISLPHYFLIGGLKLHGI